ncbi:GTP pyrophosphokinase [Serratia phage vB_SmaM-Kashira]|nr:guanosine-3',5'-bis(Diphosphate) 3'-pyrophosphohydrolase [Acinetobacter phage ABPH49]URC22816.1 GTP pyrophosphokinase [Serratia phage vB_SmaM-Kashira]
MELMSKEEQLAKAIYLAATHHHGQFDKGGQPYILHCLKVMHYVKSQDPLVKAAAVMHDLVEDTNVTLEYLLEAGFDKSVVDIVDRMTKKEGQTPEEYLNGLMQSPNATLVKLADLRHNTDIRRLKGITDKDLLRMRKYHAMWVRLDSARQLHEILHGGQ